MGHNTTAQPSASIEHMLQIMNVTADTPLSLVNHTPTFPHHYNVINWDQFMWLWLPIVGPTTALLAVSARQLTYRDDVTLTAWAKTLGLSTKLAAKNTPMIRSLDRLIRYLPFEPFERGLRVPTVLPAPSPQLIMKNTTLLNSTMFDEVA